VTSEELRSFLTSVLVTPARTRNWGGWLRSLKNRLKPSPVIQVTTEAAAQTTTGSAK